MTKDGLEVYSLTSPREDGHGRNRLAKQGARGYILRMS